MPKAGSYGIGDIFDWLWILLLRAGQDAFARLIERWINIS